MKKADSLTPTLSRQATAPRRRRGDVSDKAPSSGVATGRDVVDAINQLFAELELAYHNQYHKAYGAEGSLNVAKKYWLECLAPFSSELILKAVRQVVKTQEFLPSVATLVRACEEAMTEYGLPAAHDAYVEACCAPNPKADQAWSHPAVYLAGKQTGWFELANRPEGQVYPLFEKHYRALCQRALGGETLVVEVPRTLPDPAGRQLSAEENKARMAALREKLKSS